MTLKVITIQFYLEDVVYCRVSVSKTYTLIPSTQLTLPIMSNYGS